MRTIFFLALFVGCIMSFQLIGGGSDLPSVVNQMNGNILEMKNREVTEYFKDDTGTRRVLLGKGKDGFYGLKVSKDGQDVYDASNDQLVFNSSQNTLKIVSTGNASIVTTSDTSQVVEVTHNLGFTPIPLVFNTDGSIYHPLPMYGTSSISGGQVAFSTWFDCSVDDTKLYISVRNATGAAFGTWNFKYYLLQETAN